MNIAEAVNLMASENGMTLATVSRATGHAHTYVSSTLGRGRCPSFDNMNEIVRAAGYTICMVKQGCEPEGAIIVTETLKQKKLSDKEKAERARKERARRRKALLAELERLDAEDSE